MQVRAHWMRGGTSKCWVFEENALNDVEMSVDQILLRAFGSPDVRQLDGVGGGTSTTSKAVIVSKSEDVDFDIRFKFAQVGIDEAKVDWGSNCGNCSATVGLFAIEQGWVKAEHPQTRVRVLNENTNQYIVQTIETPEGELPSAPSEMMLGAHFGGHKVVLGFKNPEGRTTGNLFPSGEKVEIVKANGSSFEATMIDAGAPTVLVSAQDLGLVPESYSNWTTSILDRLQLLDNIRREAAVRMGLSNTPETAERAIPKIGIMSDSPDSDSDIQVLMLSMEKPHPAIPITASVAITKAAKTPGTVAHVKRASSHNLRIKTPVGVIETNLTEGDDGTEIGVVRTSRTIADASLFIPEDEFDFKTFEVA